MNDDMAKQLSVLTGKPIPKSTKRPSKKLDTKNGTLNKNKKLKNILGVDLFLDDRLFSKISHLLSQEHLSSFEDSLKSARFFDLIFIKCIRPKSWPPYLINLLNKLSDDQQSALQAILNKLILKSFDNARHEYQIGEYRSQELVVQLANLADEKTHDQIQAWLNSPEEDEIRKKNIDKKIQLEKNKLKILAEAKLKKDQEREEEQRYLARLNAEKENQKKIAEKKLLDEQLKKQKFIDEYNKNYLLILNELYAGNSNTIFFHSELDLSIEDYKLAAIWHKKEESINKIFDLKSYFRECTFGGMIQLSARNAEKIAIKFYENLGHTVQDVAGIQLSGDSHEWMHYDLQVDNKFIDVKNARTPFNNPSNYSEQYVKAFKQTSNNKQISYLGVLSKYQKETDAIANKPFGVTVLGEINQSDIDTLDIFVTKFFSGLFELSFTRAEDRHISKYSGKNGFFIPGWMFDYSESFYKRNMSQHDIKIKIRELNLFNNKNNLQRNHVSLVPEDLQFSDISIFINEVQAKFLLNRRMLFVMILGFSLRKILEKDLNYRPSQWIKHIYYQVMPIQSNQTKQWPMGRLDSQKYIYNLICMLDDLWDQPINPLTKYTSFFMQGMNILKGKKSNGSKETIYAYCGGKNLDLSDWCRTNPLIQGKDILCTSCNLLICNNCGTCYDRCNENDTRRYELKLRQM